MAECGGDRRGAVDRCKTDRVQLTVWHKDAREKAGATEGSGFAFTASYQVAEKWFPFVRLGSSDDGAGWAQPSNGLLRDEYVLEASCKWQVTPGISLTPDLQALIHPNTHLRISCGSAVFVVF